jgi:hypothetical protein
MLARGAAIVLVVAAGACSIDDAPFEATIDAGNGRIVMNRVSLTMNEGATDELLLHLESPPMLPASVSCATGNPRLAAEPSQLTFTDNGPPEQTLHLTAWQDADAMNDSLMVLCSAVNSDNAMANVDIIDDDILAILPTPDGSPPVVVGETQSTTVSVYLTAQPPVNVLVIVGHVGSEISPTPLNILFTPDNYDTPRNITVSGVRDADTTTDADTMTLSATGLTTVSVPFSITDID